jgi:hypothetical protein
MLFSLVVSDVKRKINFLESSIDLSQKVVDFFFLGQWLMVFGKKKCHCYG